MDQQPLPGTPSIWAIGDVHGCVDFLDALLARPEIADEPECRLWFVGDLINRGPASAATLRRVMGLGERATVVLGNHDLRALEIAAGSVRPGRRDTLNDIFSSPDVDELLNWLRARPLMHIEAGHVLTHAGIHPDWDAATAMSLAEEAQHALRGDDWRQTMHALQGGSPRAWSPKLHGEQRLRFIVGAFTRMRLCTRDGAMALGARATPGHWPQGTLPWFDVPERRCADTPIMFGHWATLGLLVRRDVACLDTGCVTGGVLTAFRLRDRKLLQVGPDALPAQATPIASLVANA